MVYNPDYSPILNSSANRANVLSGLGGQIGGDIAKERRIRLVTDLTKRAMNGDKEALSALSIQSPETAVVVADRLKAVSDEKTSASDQALGRASYGGGPEAEAAQQELSVRNPELNQSVMKQKGAMTEQRQKGLAYDWSHALSLANAGETQQAIDYLDKRAAAISARGGDNSHTISIKNVLANNTEEGKKLLADEISAMVDPEGFAKSQRKGLGLEGLSSEENKQKTGAFLVRDPETKKTSIAVGSYDPATGKLTTETSDMGNLEIVSKLGETAKEQTARNVEEKRDIETVKGQEKIASDIIDRGVNQAESAAMLKRGINLLQRVETGGIHSVKLAAKRLFGVEKADEGELSSSLGKAVLSQLRETFGNQFTDQEGRRLERIEAGFGKSNEANIRLLQRALRIVERNVERAKKRAEARGDTETVNDLNDLMSFELTIPELEEQPQEVKQKPIENSTLDQASTEDLWETLKGGKNAK